MYNHPIFKRLHRGLISILVLITLLYSGNGLTTAAGQDPGNTPTGGNWSLLRDNISTQHPAGASNQSVNLTAAAATGVPQLVDFENLAAGESLYSQYPSLLFLGGDATNLDGSALFKVVQPSVATASPTKALDFHRVTTCEFGCGAHLSMAFAEPQQRVSLSTGLPSMFPGTTGFTMELAGYISNPGTAALSGTPIVQSVAMNLCSDTGPTPLTQPLEIDDPAGRINFAVLAVVSCSDLNNFESGLNGATLQLDNLLYNRALNPPAGEHNPPVISLLSPTNGQSITGGSPGTFFLNVSASVAETQLARMTAQLNGGTPVLVSYYHTNPSTYAAGVLLSNLNGLVAGPNTLSVQAWDFDIPQNTSTVTINFTYTVMPPPPDSKVDIWPTAYEVNQSIDNGPILFNAYETTSLGYEVHVTNTVMLKGKPVLVRIYAGTSGTTSPIDHVPATINLDKDNCVNNCQVTAGLPPIINPTTPNLDGLTVNPLNTPAGTPGSASVNLSKTWDFLIQPQWTQQDLLVTVQVNSGSYAGLPQVAPVPECTTGLAGHCYFNNQIKLHLHFIDPPQIIVYPVSIHVTGSYHGKTFTDIQPTAKQIDDMFTQLNELYPAVVTRGDLKSITVDPGISKDDLLGKISDFYGGSLCMAQAYANIFYIGLLPTDQAGHDLGANEKGPNGFVAGYASVGVPFCGSPGAWADADNPIDPAHELGHNIGFDHWACENGVVNTDECGVFPIPHGGIGGVGIDIANWRLFPPGDNSSNATPHAHDFMSYGQLCGVAGNGGGPNCDTGEWVSWYTYNILLDHSTINSYDTQDSLAAITPVLRVSGNISPGGVATFRPLFQVNLNGPVIDSIVEDDPSSIYTLQGFDTKGNTLFVHNFEPAKLDDHDANYGKDLMFDQPIPILAGMVKLEALHGTQVLGTLTNGAAGNGPSVTITAPLAGAVWPAGSLKTVSWNPTSPAGLPLTAQVEYSPDGGQTRITLGRDISAHALSVDPDQLAGSTNAWIYVQVSDGMNSASAQVGPFTVAAKPPVVHIISPANNGVLTNHLAVTLRGTAFDRQETLLDNQFVWTSSRDGVLGSGKTLTLANGLSAGLQTITLTVIDSQSRKSQDQVTLQVRLPYALYLPSVLH